MDEKGSERAMIADVFSGKLSRGVRPRCMEPLEPRSLRLEAASGLRRSSLLGSAALDKVLVWILPPSVVPTLAALSLCRDAPHPAC